MYTIPQNHTSFPRFIKICSSEIRTCFSLDVFSGERCFSYSHDNQDRAYTTHSANDHALWSSTVFKDVWILRWGKTVWICTGDSYDRFLSISIQSITIRIRHWLFCIGCVSSWCSYCLGFNSVSFGSLSLHLLLERQVLTGRFLWVDSWSLSPMWYLPRM